LINILLWGAFSRWEFTTHSWRPIAIKAKEEGFKGFFSKQNVKEAAIVAGLDVYGVENVQEVIDFLEGKGNLEPTTIDTSRVYKDLDFPEFDFSDVKGRSL
jgi:magnesium chelatase family protein